jgi:hypothetical protein
MEQIIPPGVSVTINQVLGDIIEVFLISIYNGIKASELEVNFFFESLEFGMYNTII